MKLRVSREAKRDLLAIARFGALRFGQQQAKAYADRMTDTLNALCRVPGMAAVREGYGRPVRFHPVGSHVIAYEVQEKEVVVVRVLHGHQNWVDHV
jgi:toxin ParE1/3/4